MNVAPTGLDALTGTATYRERVALSPEAVLEVELVERSETGVGSELARASIACFGRQVPLPFSLAYQPGGIDPARRYGIVVAISAGGKTLFRTEQPVPVITGGAATDGLEVALTAAVAAGVR